MRDWWRPLLLLLLVCALSIETTTACPASCVCKWKGGKQTVECVNKSLAAMPSDVDSGTQVLDMSGNNLARLADEQFQRAGLVNLQKVYASRCRLVAVDERAFKALSNLVELDLANNILAEVPQLVLDDVPSLMRLSLSGNPLRRLRAFAFKELRQLLTLELSRCQLETIEREAFYGLASLELLKLDYNALRFVAGPQPLPGRLRGVSLQHNPWFCDCRLADLYAWLNASAVAVSQAVEPTCDGPARLRGAPIKLLDEQELACPPHASPASLHVRLAEGENASLLCRVKAAPEARVSWHWRGRLVTGGGGDNSPASAVGVDAAQRPYHVVEEGAVEKRSQLFVWNADVRDNGTFVCVAENQAGRALCNFTVSVAPHEQPAAPAPGLPAEYVASACAAGAVLLVAAVTCLVAGLARRQLRRCRRAAVSDEKGKQAASYRDGDGRASPTTARNGGTTQSAFGDARLRKSNGAIFIADRRPPKTTTTTTTTTATATDAAARASRLFYTSAYHSAPEPNPDLLNDTGNGRDKPGAGAGHRQMDECWAAGAEWPALGLSSRPSVIDVPIDVRFDRFPTPPDFGLAADATVAAYPADLGLPKLSTHFPPIVPATAFYRTLPHRRHQAAAAAPAAAARNSALRTREAEFVSRSTQPAPYEHLLGNDVRYNVEGYPKGSPAYAAYAPRVSFSDTVQILGKCCNDGGGGGDATGPAAATAAVARGERRISVSLVNAAAQTRLDDLSPSAVGDSGCARVGDSGCARGGGGGPADSTSSTSAKPPAGLKSVTDSPDEGYVGEGPDATEV